ncbi:hypothetical protein C5167_031559 [Papaver somniferum]|uniref:Uncharacterized protein n=1 Tax=Papaver somniferum TaxID=3469 RepID=A0A4Y7K7W4_PAPSO|nr:hypothetical protein C5167_031559 [Papaver somniferum]
MGHLKCLFYPYCKFIKKLTRVFIRFLHRDFSSERDRDRDREREKRNTYKECLIERFMECQTLILPPRRKKTLSRFLSSPVLLWMHLAGSGKHVIVALGRKEATKVLKSVFQGDVKKQESNFRSRFSNP